MVPPEDYTYDVPQVLSFNGDRLRYEYTAREWIPERSEYVAQEYLSTFDGMESRILRPPAVAKWPVGQIRDENMSADVTTINAQAVLMTYRAMHPKMSVIGTRKPESFRLTGDRPTLRGHVCVLLESPPRSPSTASVALWVAPELDFSILRYALSRNGRIFATIDIDYRKDAAHGWVPSEWRTTYLNLDGSMKQSGVARLVIYELNPTFPADHFRPPFPTGTYVVNERSREKYIELENGTRPVLPEELGATYEQLVNTKPGDAWKYRPAGGFGIWTITLWSAIGVLCLAGAWVVYRWRRRH